MEQRLSLYGGGGGEVVERQFFSGGVYNATCKNDVVSKLVKKYFKLIPSTFFLFALAYSRGLGPLR